MNPESLGLNVATVVVGAIGVGILLWWLFMLIEAVRTSDPLWKTAGQSKWLHVLAMVFLGVLGTLIYVVTARPALRRSATGPTGA